MTVTAETFTREEWSAGETAWFEYHCYESDESADAPAWRHSPQQVTVLRHTADHDCLRPSLFDERGEDGQPCIYRVRFADGLEWDVFEDELLSNPAGYVRPEPPELPA